MRKSIALGVTALVAMSIMSGCGAEKKSDDVQSNSGAQSTVETTTNSDAQSGHSGHSHSHQSGHSHSHSQSGQSDHSGHSH